MAPTRTPTTSSALARAQRADAERFRQAFLLAVLVAVVAVASPLGAQPAADGHVQSGAPHAAWTGHPARR